MNSSVTYDAERVQFNIARLKKGGSNYEVVVEPDNAIAFKEGDKIDLDEILKAQEIFFDAKKGERASEERMQEIFSTTDPLEVAKIILKEGDIQLTAEHRNKVRESKRKQLIQFICRNACDPKTKLPHPANRIEKAMDEAKVRIDEFKRVEDQVADTIKLLRPIIPISVEMREAFIHIPARFTGKAYSALQKMGTIKKEEWKADGAWEGSIEIPSGMFNTLIDKVNALTHGDATVDMLK